MIHHSDMGKPLTGSKFLDALRKEVEREGVIESGLTLQQLLSGSDKRAFELTEEDREWLRMTAVGRECL